MNTRSEGFTLVELLIVTVLGSLILAAVFNTLLQQHEAYRRHDVTVTAQQTTRTVLDVLSGELREVSSGGGDVIMADGDSITIRAFRGVGFVCNADAPGQRVDVWNLGAPFAREDSLLIFAAGHGGGSAGDAWRLMRVVQQEAVSCPGDWYGDGATMGGAAVISQRLNVPSGDAVKITDIEVGAPVRSFEHVTYGLFNVEGEWVLGQRRQGDPSPVPLIGPVAPPGQNRDGGLVIRYFDGDGVELTSLPLAEADRQSIERLEISVRAVSRDPSFDYEDSLVTQVYVRNR